VCAGCESDAPGRMPAVRRGTPGRRSNVRDKRTRLQDWHRPPTLSSVNLTKVPQVHIAT